VRPERPDSDANTRLVSRPGALAAQRDDSKSWWLHFTGCTARHASSGLLQALLGSKSVQKFSVNSEKNGFSVLKIHISKLL
jgi:hypothetical protein